MISSRDGATRIRVHNASDYDWTDLIVQTPGAKQKFASLAAHAYTEYRDFGESYSYAYVSFTAGGAPFLLQPIDYVGEAPLGPGNFVYEISIPDFNSRALEIKAIKE
jgi:hypothetical protein